MNKILSQRQKSQREPGDSVYRFNPELRPAYVDPNYIAANAILNDPGQLFYVDTNQALHEAYEMFDRELISYSTFSTLTLYLHAIHTKDSKVRKVSLETDGGDWMELSTMKRVNFSLALLVNTEDKTWSDFGKLILKQMYREYSLSGNNLYAREFVQNLIKENPIQHWALRFSFSIQELREANWQDGHELSGIAELLGVGTVLRKADLSNMTNAEIKRAFSKKTSVVSEETRPPCWAVLNISSDNEDELEIVLLPESVEAHILNKMFPHREMIKLSHTVGDVGARELVEELSETSRLSYLGSPSNLLFPSNFDNFKVTGHFLKVVHDHYHRMRCMMTPKEVISWAKAIYLDCLNSPETQEIIYRFLYQATGDRIEACEENIKEWEGELFSCVDIDVPSIYHRKSEALKKVILADQFIGALLNWSAKKLNKDINPEDIDVSELRRYFLEKINQLERIDQIGEIDSQEGSESSKRQCCIVS